MKFKSAHNLLVFLWIFPFLINLLVLIWGITNVYSIGSFPTEGHGSLPNILLLLVDLNLPYILSVVVASFFLNDMLDVVIDKSLLLLLFMFVFVYQLLICYSTVDFIFIDPDQNFDVYANYLNIYKFYFKYVLTAILVFFYMRRPNAN